MEETKAKEKGNEKKERETGLGVREDDKMIDHREIGVSKSKARDVE